VQKTDYIRKYSTGNRIYQEIQYRKKITSGNTVHVTDYIMKYNKENRLHQEIQYK